jgi:hypothetical protein
MGISLIYHSICIVACGLCFCTALGDDYLIFSLLSFGNSCLTAYVVRDTLQPFHSFVISCIHRNPPPPGLGSDRVLFPVFRDSLFSFLSTEYNLLFPTWLSILLS